MNGAPLSLLVAMTATTTSVEELRLERAAAAMPEVVARMQPLLAAVPAENVTEAEALRHAAALWRTAAGSQAVADDRSLYWARLALLSRLRQAGLHDSVALQRAERRSRGLDDVAWTAAADLRVLVTGFDPFHLDREITQSNPSGLAVLGLDGRIFEARNAAGDQVRAELKSAVMPVRFADFDAGIVESLLEPLLASASAPHLLVTISQGRDAFDLERFPGRRRSAEVPDNLNVLTGASRVHPLVPLLDGEPLPGAEFLEFSLPAATMRAVRGRWAVRDNRNVTTLEQGDMEAPSLESLAGLTAVRGSGGGYLSNEIAYRTLRLIRQRGAVTRVGHLHTPAVLGYDAKVEAAMVEQIEALLRAAIAGL